MCNCDGGYIGSRCQLHVAAIAVPTLLGVVAFLSIIYFIGRHYYRQLALNAQLMSTDWMAEWDTIRMRQKKNKSSVKSLLSMISMVSGKSETTKEDKPVCQNQG